MNTSELTLPFSLIINRMWPFEVIAESKLMPSAGCYHNGRFAFLAPSAPGMMIRADMRRIAKIDVRTQCFRGFLDLRKFRRQPFLDQRRIAFQRLA
jgi:hypothetical protein